ncbi:MAG: chromosome segregation protein SMC [Anaerolinea sp.]|nr:chromosome segregation protein SMC [Anaerolinea sp.]
MPLRLKSLELHGYKTFVAKTTFEFAEGITAIVGPNGSGKSNIADALRWVLGEQSYSLLRAKKTEDLIFAGSEQRPRAGMASAAVTFDNSDGWLPVDFSEVALARRAYRDGRNEYFLNSQHVRLREINELLAQSGLSERTYTILGQGLVDASLALKADERRRLFEEAAGIGLYRARREESLRRLETTHRNLDRVLDILAELEPRLRGLERQAKKANEFAQVQADLRLLLLDWYGYHWHHAQKELTEARESARGHEAKLHAEREKYQAVRQNYAAFRDRLQGLRGRLSSWHRQSASLQNTRQTISRDLAVLDERHRALLDNRQSALSEQSRLAEEVRIAVERLAEAGAEAARLQSEYDEAQAQMKSAQEALEMRQAERAKAEQALQAVRQNLNKLNTRRAQLQARLDELKTRGEGQRQKLETAGQAIIRAEEEARKAELQRQSALAARQRAEALHKQAESDLLAAQKRLAGLVESIREKQSARSAREAEKARSKAQLEVLEQAEQSFAGYADGARILLDAARQARLKGARGALSAALDVPVELELAIGAALGEYTDAVLLESGNEAEQALTLLDADQSGRAALLPLDWLAPSPPLLPSGDADCLGLAADLVKAPAELRPALDLLLGQTLVVRDRSAARRILAGQANTVRVVTLRGEVFSANGPVLAGRQARAGTLGRPRQRRELQDALAGLDRQIKAFDENIQELDREINSARGEVNAREGALREKRLSLESALAAGQQAQVQSEAARRQRDWQAGQKDMLQTEIAQGESESQEAAAALSNIEKEAILAQEDIRARNVALAALTLEEYQAQVTHWKTRSAVVERALVDARSRQTERQEAISGLQGQAASLEKRLAEIDRSLTALENEKEALRGQEGGLHAQLEELRVLIEPAEKELETAEAQEAALQEQESSSQQTLTLAERRNTQLQLDLSRKQEALDNLRQKIEDDFGLVAFDYAAEVGGPMPLPLDGMVEQLPRVAELPPDLEENLTRQRAQLRRMGAVNPEAQKEYDSVKERFEFLNAQLADLRKAESDLHQVIAELDELTRRDFQKTFSAVAVEFHSIFHRLFGGGSAQLVLTDPDNLSETGIDIEARLPGRREQGLALLSGGERSLTAIALVFALLKVSPTPVCVLDEVDAMLDEANVGRFRGLLLELSQDTQFIIITHNRNTVQAADVIYGVTMGRDSTSQVISLKLDEVSDELLRGDGR